MLDAGTPSEPDVPATEVLGWFDNSRGGPSVDVDAPRVARFVRPRLHAIARQLGNRDVRHRHMVIWALGVTGDPRAARHVVAALDRRANWFTHDFVFEAARQLGRRGVPAFERIARTAKPEIRMVAIECIGTSRGGATAVAALRRHVVRFGFRDGVLNALYNVHHPRTLGVTVAALESRNAAQLCDAAMAIAGALEALPPSASIPHRARLARGLLATFDTPDVRTKPGDPWASLFGFALEALLRLDRRACRELVAQLAASELADDRRDELREIRRQLHRR